MLFGLIHWPFNLIPMNTILWHDYETFGIDPAQDRPCQFAAIRTDLDLQLVEEPISFYSQPTADVLPAIDACLVTGITPQLAFKEGLPEPRFFAKIYQEMIRPNTCSAGYNSLRFDDEVTRHGFFRNFYDPYGREWQNGNSRWDVIDMVRACYALRPGGIQWPESEPGVPSFRLELLTAANGIDHGNAHDALSDVRATIALAQLIREKQPKLYEYYWGLRKKRTVSDLIDLRHRKPMVHVSSKIPASQGCTTLVMPLVMHPENANGVVCLDLTVDPRSWLNESAEVLREHLYQKAEQLPKGAVRPPIKTIHLNRSPFIAPLTMLDPVTAERFDIDLSAAQEHWKAYLAEPNLEAKVVQILERSFDAPRDVESSLYSGFIPNTDRPTCERVTQAQETALASDQFHFQDERLQALLFRYRARHFPNSLSPPEQAQWQADVHTKFFSCADNEPSFFDRYMHDLVQRLNDDGYSEQREILHALKNWAIDFQHRFSKA